MSLDRGALFLGWLANKHMVGNRVPRVVNTDEEQQERHGSDREEALALVGRCDEGCDDERRAAMASPCSVVIS